MGRPYRQQARAEKTQQTRSEIIEAGVSLIGSSPAPPSVAAVAQTAGVSRPTVYAHFTDTQELMLALSDHQQEQYPPPDIEDLSDVEEPRDRTELALAAVYRQWEANGEAGMPAGMDEIIDTIVGAFQNEPEDVRRRRSAVARVAVSFGTWHLLRAQGLDHGQAVEVMTDLVVRTP